MTVTHDGARLAALNAARWKRAAVLTVVMIALYFGFILLIAYDKPLMGSLVTPGLSLGILLGVLVIVVSWLLTWFYVRWANDHYDRELRELQEGVGGRVASVAVRPPEHSRVPR